MFLDDLVEICSAFAENSSIQISFLRDFEGYLLYLIVRFLVK